MKLDESDETDVFSSVIQQISFRIESTGGHWAEQGCQSIGGHTTRMSFQKKRVGPTEVTKQSSQKLIFSSN
jgi:hypothetical protein